MPELPEVEVLVRHLRPLLRRQTIRSVAVHRARVIRPTKARQLHSALAGATFLDVTRRAKFLVFRLRRAGGGTFTLLGHLGMTGRMYLQRSSAPLPRHAAVVLGLGARVFVFEDTRYFGRFTLAVLPLDGLGPEPLSEAFRPDDFAGALKRSRQAIKVKLLDQTLVAGVGNIYASEALFVAGIPPRKPARRLTRTEVQRLWSAIRSVLREAVALGSTVPIDYAGTGRKDGLFYYGRASGAPDFYEERLRVYDRAGQPCRSCGTRVRRTVQAARSTYWCPRCQPA